MTIPQPDQPTALSNLRVLEVASAIAGPYCGKLLASLGANVIKVEPPTGDPSRRRGPFPDDVPHPERSGLYLYLNTGKQSVTLNLADPSARELLHQLVASVAMVIHDYSPAAAVAVGLDGDSLLAVNPDVIVTAVTPFGSTGPYADYHAGHLATFHAGGEGWLLPNGVALDTFPDRPPIIAGANMGDYQAGLTAAVGAVSAAYHRLGAQGDARGQVVDASGQEAQLSVGYMPIQRHESEGITETRFSRYFRVGGVLPASDGYVELLTLELRQFGSLLDFMGHPDWASPDMFSDPATHGPELNRRMKEWFAQHPREWLYAEGQAHGVPNRALLHARRSVPQPAAARARLLPKRGPSGYRPPGIRQRTLPAGWHAHQAATGAPAGRAKRRRVPGFAGVQQPGVDGLGTRRRNLIWQSPSPYGRGLG